MIKPQNGTNIHGTYLRFRPRSGAITASTANVDDRQEDRQLPMGV
jgi:hypothetical protein